jgi:glycosyltransferase involved in cell wall biosynthesis
MRKKILYVVSSVTDSTEYDLLIEHWDRARFDLEFVLMNPMADCGLQQNILKAGFPCTTILYMGRQDSVKAIRAIMGHYKRIKPDIIHLNLLEATFFGLVAARLTGIGRTVYTRHHSTHNHKYHPIKGVMYDRICNRLADRIIAITNNTEEILVEWEKVPKEKVVLIYHGYDMSAVPKPDPAKIAALSAKHGIRTDGRAPIVGMIARPFEWKGLDHAIPAFRLVLEQYPKAKLCIFNWKMTPHTERYERLLATLPEGSWHTVYFEPEVVALFPAFDVLVHVPEDQHAEAFGLVYAEALMTGVPSVFTRSGIMHDLDLTRCEGISMVPFKDTEAIARSMVSWLGAAPNADQRAGFAKHNSDYLREVIDIRMKMKALNDLYDSM